MPYTVLKEFGRQKRLALDLQVFARLCEPVQIKRKEPKGSKTCGTGIRTPTKWFRAIRATFTPSRKYFRHSRQKKLSVKSDARVVQ